MANEKRLIDANALLEKLSRMIDYCQDNKLEDEMSALFQVGDAVMDCPTVDAVEVVHGEWRVTETIPTLEKQMMCSACRCIWYYPEARWNDIRLTNYRPNCGAKMDGDGNG